VGAFALTLAVAQPPQVALGQRATPASPARSLVVAVADTADSPLSDVDVLIPALRLHHRTDTAGRVTVVGPLGAGHYVIVARRLGFLPDSQRVAVRAGIDPPMIAFRLRTSAHVLDTARVESAALRDKMADFERRRASGRGTFITRSEIDRRNPLTLADVLRTIRGLTIRSGGGRTEVRFVRANTRVDGVDCPPEMWVDGVRTYGATVDEFRPDEVEGIELYRGLGQLPAEYLSRSAGCGLVMIWTRSPSRMPR
jgi:hypothetical protein